MRYAVTVTETSFVNDGTAIEAAVIVDLPACTPFTKPSFETLATDVSLAV